MKKVLALVLTLAMLVGTLAVGLSAAFEYTATEEGDVFENVYSIPLGSKAAAVTYLAFDSSTFEDTINIEFDIWFTSEDGFIGDGTYGSPINDTGPYHLSITPDKIGLGSNGNAVSTLDYAFALNTKYTVAFRTGGAEEGKTLIRVNGEDIGQVEGRLAKDYSTICGADLVVVDNIKVSDGNNYQVEEDFEDSSWDGHVSGSSGAITESIEIRRDLGKKYMTTGSDTGILYQLIEVLGDDGTGKVNEYSDITISFDVSFPSQQATNYVESWGSHAPSVYPNMITLGDSGTYADRPTIEYTFEYGEWYYVEFVCDGTDTDVYVDGVLAGTLNAPIRFGRDGALANNDKFWNPYIFNAAVDNVAVNGYAHTFEDESTQYCIMQSGDPITATSDYVGEEIDIWEEISTYDVEGEAIILKAPYNEEKNPTPTDANFLYVEESPSYAASSYVVNFDLALYPDQENVTNFEERYENGTWLEFVVNGMQGGDNDRVKFGDKFVGKGYDLYYYGDQETLGEYAETIKSMQQWTAGEFHNVTVYVANGLVTLYIDKQEVYSAPTGTNSFSGLNLFYVWNGTAVIDNYRVYDSDFALQDSEFTHGNVMTATGTTDTPEAYVGTISDVTLTGADFCAANGHINYWTRTVDPKCYEMGTNTYTCWVCGNEDVQQEVPMLEHNFEDYDITRVNEDGLVYTYCSTSEGCPERRYVQLPEAEDYTGTIEYFHDFQDDFIRQTGSASWYWTIENGVATYSEGNDDNYNEIYLGRSQKTGAELNEGFKLGFDFIYNGTYATDDTAQYGNTFYLHVGRDVFTGSAMVGYDAVAQQFYISSESSFPEVRSEVYALVPGETYNFEVEFDINHDTMEGVMALYINGVKVVELDAMTVYDYLTYDDGAEISMFLMRNFGVAMSIDNFVMGSSDFAWNRQYQGDVDGDYAITLSDALLMRRYLAKIDGIETLVASRADANGDGVIDARDQLRIRKAIAAAE